jgi:hypothetical protein
MPGYDDDKTKETLKKAADRQMPDAWRNIERSIQNMDKKNVTNQGKRFRGWPMAATACAAFALVAVAVIAKPGFLFKPVATTVPTTAAISTPVATTQPTAAPTVAPTTAPTTAATATADSTQVRQPIPFTDKTSLSLDKGPSLKIMFYDTLKDFTSADYNTDIAQFKFVKELGSEATADGMALHTSYQMQVVKVFKGSLKVGDLVTVRVFGGASDKVWIEDNFVERFTGDFGYVLFLSKVDGSKPVVYQLASTLQGYVPLQNDKVSLNTKIAGNGLFTQGETLADLSAQIEAAVK